MGTLRVGIDVNGVMSGQRMSDDLRKMIEGVSRRVRCWNLRSLP